MKTFVATFLAILAAAAVIFTALWAKHRIDQWELAKNMCYAQVETEMKMMQLRTTRDQSEMRAMAQSAMDSHDVLGVAQRAVASLDAIKESRGNTVEIERKLVAILDAKPFGLPLTAQEKKDLETAKRDIADAEEADKKDKAKADEAQKPPPPEMITLTRDVPFQTASGILTLPVGTKLQFVSQTKTEVRARYLNTDYAIPIDFTDLLIP
jgi:hypothetical protein